MAKHKQTFATLAVYATQIVTVEGKLLTKQSDFQPGQPICIAYKKPRAKFATVRNIPYEQFVGAVIGPDGTDELTFVDNTAVLDAGRHGGEGNIVDGLLIAETDAGLMLINTEFKGATFDMSDEVDMPELAGSRRARRAAAEDTGDAEAPVRGRKPKADDGEPKMSRAERRAARKAAAEAEAAEAAPAPKRRAAKADVDTDEAPAPRKRRAAEVADEAPAPRRRERASWA